MIGTTALGEGEVNMVPQDDVAQEANEDKNVLPPLELPLWFRDLFRTLFCSVRNPVPFLFGTLFRRVRNMEHRLQNTHVSCHCAPPRPRTR
jgi:hypothetical protein